MERLGSRLRQRQQGADVKRSRLGAIARQDPLAGRALAKNWIVDEGHAGGRIIQSASLCGANHRHCQCRTGVTLSGPRRKGLNPYELPMMFGSTTGVMQSDAYSMLAARDRGAREQQDWSYGIG